MILPSRLCSLVFLVQVQKEKAAIGQNITEKKTENRVGKFFT